MNKHKNGSVLLVLFFLGFMISLSIFKFVDKKKMFLSEYWTDEITQSSCNVKEDETESDGIHLDQKGLTIDVDVTLITSYRPRLDVRKELNFGESSEIRIQQNTSHSPNLKCKHYNLPMEMLHYQSILKICLEAKFWNSE